MNPRSIRVGALKGIPRQLHSGSYGRSELANEVCWLDDEDASRDSQFHWGSEGKVVLLSCSCSYLSWWMILLNACRRPLRGVLQTAFLLMNACRRRLADYFGRTELAREVCSFLPLFHLCVLWAVVSEASEVRLYWFFLCSLQSILNRLTILVISMVSLFYLMALSKFNTVSCWSRFWFEFHRQNFIRLSSWVDWQKIVSNERADQELQFGTSGAFWFLIGAEKMASESFVLDFNPVPSWAFSQILLLFVCFAV